MLRAIPTLGAILVLAAPAAADVTPPVSERFARPDTQEVAGFQRHVLPLMGRLGCNGRSCHGSFQGQGGFRLSLFGYDFQADHDALLGKAIPPLKPAKGKPAPPEQPATPRIDFDNPRDSLILLKPTLTRPHKGGRRMEVGSWQYRVFLSWIQAGGRYDATAADRLERLEITPEQLIFHKPGDQVQLRVVAHWSDGSAENVTDLARFRTNDEAIATVSDSGLVKAAGPGDTHVVAFYDNGVVPVPVVLPVSDRLGDRYPAVPAPTRVDELVTAKLRRCGIVPSELCTDVEFLRRTNLDITGTLPTAAEVEAFLADRSPDKRARKIDELLERPAYAAWWATKLCDFTGNSGYYRDARFGPDFARQWYEWVYRRVRDNVGYDKIVAGIVLADSRRPGQSFDDYCREMSSYFRKDNPPDFAERPTMPHYWSRLSVDTPQDKALNFSYAFLGVHLQCAQCHKHPFDQWTKKDFERFTAFFDRVAYGTPAGDREAYAKMEASLIPAVGAGNAKQALAQAVGLVREGKAIPWREVYVTQPGDPDPRGKGKKNLVLNKGARPARAVVPKLLGDEELARAAEGDLRPELMKWMLREDNPYFARALVNRVWAAYFNAGIVEPPDDLSLANPPSNAPLLDYLAHGFREHGYDLKWLHREIATSRTYQLSCRPNDTNRLDNRNFSRALPRRLPAEVAYDAIFQATAGDDGLAAWQADRQKRSIALGAGYSPKSRGKPGNVLAVFGKPDRRGNCDCDRSNDASLLQTLFLLNDGEILGMLDRPDGWVADVGRKFGLAPPLKGAKRPAEPGASGKKKPLDPAAEEARARAAEKLRRKIEQLRAEGKTEEAAALKRGLASKLAAATAAKEKAKLPEPARRAATPEEEASLIRTAYLRTVSRPPIEQELTRARQYLHESPNIAAGVRDLLWALLNTNEFIVNH